MTRWQRACLRAHLVLVAVGEWCLRWIYAQHNARVIVDFEDRMVNVIYAASGGMMSKPYYTVEAMIEQIEQAQSNTRDEWYAEGRKEAFDDMDEVDPLIDTPAPE